MIPRHLRQCDRCAVVKHLSRFELKQDFLSSNDPRLPTCSDCMAEMATIRIRAATAERRRKWLESPERAALIKATRSYHSSARRTRELNATPWWADADAIYSVYKNCERITRETGVKHHVDHIVPLKGRGICGLHVQWNLRVIEARENIRKGNRFDENELAVGYLVG